MSSFSDANKKPGWRRVEVWMVQSITLPQEQIEFISDLVMGEWQRRQKVVEDDLERFDMQIKELKLEAEQTVKKLKYLASETDIKYIENDLVNIEGKKKEEQEPVNMDQIMSRVKYFLENLDKLLVKQNWN